MDYITIMEEKKREFNFINLYEDSINKIIKTFDIQDQELIDDLRKKRAFGVEKYKEFSFQTSLENCLYSPTIIHAYEEIVDLFNYLFHEIYKNEILHNVEEKEKLISLVNQLSSFYYNFNKLKKHILNKG